MRLDVPFYEQETGLDCARPSLRMVLDFLGESLEREELDKVLEVKESRIVYTVQVATASARLGYDTVFYTVDAFNPRNF